MTSPKQQAANRANARRSTGPRTADGKNRARRNALRHGLAVPTAALPEYAATVTALVKTLVGLDPVTPEVHAAASRVAEAIIDLRRVQAVRLVLLQRIVQYQDPMVAFDAEPELERPARLKISMATRIKAIQDGTHAALREIEVAHIMAQARYEGEVELRRELRAEALESQQHHRADWNQLIKLERYERRARSRCNRAIRDFDTVRVGSPIHPAARKV